MYILRQILRTLVHKNYNFLTYGPENDLLPIDIVAINFFVYAVHYKILIILELFLTNFMSLLTPH